MLPDLAHGQDIFGSPELRTKMKILHAVDKSLDRITIAEICENAGISRQTFYRHFQSKYDIPWWHSIFCRQFIQHGLTTNRTAMDWFQRYYPEHRVHAVNFPGDPYPIHIDATFVPLRPGLIINNPQRKLPEEQRAIFEANDWQIVDAAQPAHSEPPEFCYSSVWLSMNCLVLDPKTVIVEASEVYQQEEMDKLGMNVIPVDLRGAYAFGGGLHCSTADVYREGECLDYFPNRVADPTLVRPEMWND